VKVNRLVATIG